ncbi:hypothetical protein [Alkalicoccus chagannorensis]|uniref:hypothetical protein n=1 Tax=Alkalicoccus chagannorensis TaxID=427072 RepID=UPI000418DA0B|nr:hypothetical protein [Alkalicoccus chagannorensis]
MRHLSEASTFETKADLNAAVADHLRACRAHITDTDYAVLSFVAQHAVKYPGAAQLKADTIASGVDKSNATARRSLRKLAALGVLAKRQLLRPKSGGWGANVYVIQRPAQSHDHSHDHSPDSASPRRPKPQPANQPGETTSKATSNKPEYTNDTETPLPAAMLRANMPKAVYKALAPYFDARELYGLAGAVFKAKSRHSNDIIIEHHAAEFTDVLRAAVLRYKAGKVKPGKLQGYVYTAVSRLCTAITVREKLGAREYDWLGAGIN